MTIIYRMSQESNRLNPLVGILCRHKFTQLFAIHILTHVPIFVNLSRYF